MRNESKKTSTSKARNKKGKETPKGKEESRRLLERKKEREDEMQRARSKDDGWLKAIQRVGDHTTMRMYGCITC